MSAYIKAAFVFVAICAMGAFIWCAGGTEWGTFEGGSLGALILAIASIVSCAVLCIAKNS